MGRCVIPRFSRKYLVHISAASGFLKDLMSTKRKSLSPDMQAHSHSEWRRHCSYTTAYTVVGIESPKSSEHNYQDISCTNHSLVDWPALLQPGIEPPVCCVGSEGI